MLLSTVESNCFHERNVFQHFTEILEQLGWSTFLIFQKISVVFVDRRVAFCRPFAFDLNLKFFQNPFYQSKVIVLIKEMVFSHRRNIWSSFGKIFNFNKSGSRNYISDFVTYVYTFSYFRFSLVVFESTWDHPDDAQMYKTNFNMVSFL